MSWHLVGKKAAMEMSMPRVEKAIDRLEDALGKLKEQPGEYDVQETYCLCSRKAEVLLRATWSDRGGHYRTASLNRLVDLLRVGLDRIQENPATSQDGKYTSKDILTSIGPRLAWVESILTND